MKEFYYDKMMDAQKEAFAKFQKFSTDDREIYKFAHMLLEAESEGVRWVDHFLDVFDINNLDKWAILEDLPLFIEEYNELAELDYMTSTVGF